ncbi:conserved hypothetical protein [Verticillium alfalfae VaMs.102]|uniref:Major facilitator superfamily (MFS) profile domain-containing protein n=1 Tax=Verticillium alfalfae (strain VaMs.102 / ATCC MYA-4576 / FGSC 10136) TaxID=526221 RepID=C9S9I1_VERA1|nr:conserved hypothetical protein [Verticillium alfalfae VaMs.102]EEY16044.1 conserved hypothetical protein [Verticillium alfalfae VaMs.102]
MPEAKSHELFQEPAPSGSPGPTTAQDSDSPSDAGEAPATAKAGNEKPSDIVHALEIEHGIKEKALIRKIDYKLLPALGLLYLLSFLDRSNAILVSVSEIVTLAVGSFHTDSRTAGNEFRRTLCSRGHLLNSGCLLSVSHGGIVATLLGIVHNLAGFLSARFFLGVAEAGYFPAVVYILSMYYKRDERQYRISLFFSAASLAGAFGGILAYPTIIRDLGYSSWRAQLLTVPVYAFSFATTLTVAIYSERLKQRAIFIAGSSFFAIIGYIMLLANTDPTGRPGLSYAGTFFAAGGIYPATALVLSWPAINVSGQTKRAIGNAMQITIGNCGAILGTQLYRANDGPRFIIGHSFALGYLAANILVCATLRFILKRENTRREQIAKEVKEIGELTDWPGDSDPRWRFQY